jgi:hypothetical protein
MGEKLGFKGFSIISAASCTGKQPVHLQVNTENHGEALKIKG